MSTLSIINNFELDSQGSIETGKQGPAAAGFDEAYDIEVDGYRHSVVGVLADDAVVTVYDDDDDVPADWDYMHVKADGTLTIQMIGPTMNAKFKIIANVPFTMAYNGLNAEANATPITGAAEPTLSDIDSIILGNYSGAPVNFSFKLMS